MLKEGQKDDDRRRLLILLKDFPPGPVLSEEELEDYRGKLTDEKAVAPIYHNYTYDQLKLRGEFKTWMSADHGSLLLLKGKTPSMRTEDCWLSLAALDFYRNLLKSSEHVVIFVQAKGKAKSYELIWTIICQLLEVNPELAHDDIAIREKRSSDAWRKQEPTLPCKLLAKFLQGFSKTVIVIDRLDRCECAATVFLSRLLVEVVRSSLTKVKVLVVFEEMAPSNRIHREDIGSDDEHFQVIEEDQKSTRG